MQALFVQRAELAQAENLQRRLGVTCETLGSQKWTPYNVAQYLRACRLYDKQVAKVETLRGQYIRASLSA
jgi:hypothetical protein